jgi:UDP-N-acetyl-D-galactosamine dehydrogenase
MEMGASSSIIFFSIFGDLAKFQEPLSQENRFMASSRKIAVVGLGYVGLPIAVHFGKKGPVTGFDINASRVEELNKGFDRNRDLKPEEFEGIQTRFTADPADLSRADFLIVTVPTPVDGANRPDFTPLRKASETVGKNLTRGAIVVYESTVYPGATEEICVPILERESGLKCGVDFKVGYSPERINPGDTEHTFTKITKVVSGMDAETLEIVAAVYSSVVTAGVYKAASIKVAEAAKVIENTQRDVNIALVNELALIFQRAGIDTQDVLAAAGTKWNFLRFQPGLVGGHCIGVDPYYLTHKAEELGYHPRMILSGRRVNDGMGAYVARETVKRVLREGAANFGAGRPTITVLGLTFKEDVPDLRNSKVADILAELEAHGFDVQVADPMAYPDEAKHEYGVALTPMASLKPAHGVILAVAHADFKKLGWAGMTKLLVSGRGVVSDIKNVLPREGKPDGVSLWRL